MDKQETDIGACPAHWQVVKFSSVAELKHGYQFRTNDFTESGIKVFKITQIKSDGSIDLSSCSFIDESRLESFTNNIINNGDILMALSGATIGKIGRFRSNEVVLQNYRVGNFIPLDEEIILKDYFYYFLTTENTYYQIMANQNQSAQENVGKADIHNMLVFLPPFEEQKSIAEVLSSLDDKIDLLLKQNQTLENLGQILLSKCFEKANSKEEPFSNYFDLLGGFPFKSNSYVENGTYKVLTIKAVQDGYLETSNAATLIELPDKLKEYQKLSTGDILMSLTGNVGRVCLVDETNCLLNQRVALIKPKNPQLECFAYFFFRQSDMIKRLTYLSKGSAQLNLSPVETLDQKEFFPSEESLTQFRNVADPILAKIISNKLSIKKVKALRDTLLPKLISGDARIVTDE